MEENILDDFSVIIQGKVFGSPRDPYEKQLTLQCIESVRKVIPNAEIIISTWEKTDVSHLYYDKVVFNHDPGAIPFNDNNPSYLNNNNRQIVSTCNGLKAATRKYGIKMRGDCQLINASFLDYLHNYARAPQYNFLKQRVIIPTIYSRNPRRIALLFHPSDIFQVGLLEDLLSLWNIPLQPEPQTTHGVPVNKRIINDALPGQGFRLKLCSEQYLWYAFAKQRGLDLELDNYSQLPISKILKSEVSIINNFLIADAMQIGLLLPKRMRDHKVRDLYTYQEWQELYKRYCLTGTSKLYEIGLILKVHTSNIRMITIRIVKSISYRTKSLIKKIIGGSHSNVQATIEN